MDRRLLYIITGAFAIAALTQLFPTWLMGQSPQSSRFTMSVLTRDLAGQPHACVPLGWNPAPVAGSYYPSYSALYREDGVWLHPYWLGLVYKSQLTEVQVRSVYNVMNALVRVGMLNRTDLHDALLYRMTVKAEPYYYEDNGFGNNPDHLPYLCYSYYEPQRVVEHRRINDGLFKVTFQLRQTPPAGWGNDLFLQRHSVVLAPREQALMANLSSAGGRWHVRTLVPQGPMGMLPYAIDPSTWPRPNL